MWVRGGRRGSLDLLPSHLCGRLCPTAPKVNEVGVSYLCGVLVLLLWMLLLWLCSRRLPFYARGVF